MNDLRIICEIEYSFSVRPNDTWLSRRFLSHVGTIPMLYTPYVLFLLLLQSASTLHRDVPLRVVQERAQVWLEQLVLVLLVQFQLAFGISRSVAAM